MSREIKFRAWWADQKIMVYEVGVSARGDSFKWGHKSTRVMWPAMFPRQLTMQYTGLKDKNGKEIYEGDILREVIGINMYTYLVKFGQYKDCDDWGNYEESGNGWYIYDLKDGEIDGFRNSSECLIIGNMYENPELLKGTSHETKAVD